MGKKGKDRKADLLLAEKIDRILHEIEAAQGQKATPEKLLLMVSSYLEKESFLAIPLIEALARIPNSETARLLTGMMARAEEKWVIKSIKRTLYKLRQRGVSWEEKPSRDEPAVRPPKPAQPEGYLGTIDSTGSRIIVIAKPQSPRGILVALGIVNDLEGIQQFNFKEFSKKGFKEFVKGPLSSVDFPIVETPGACCIHLLKEASSLHQRLSKPLPRGYHDAEKEFKDITWDDPSPIIYQYIKEDEVKDRPHFLKDSVNLHKIMPFSSWFLPGQELQDYVSSITEAQESKIILTPGQKDERINSIYMKALYEVFPENRRLLWKRRLEEMAYILLKTGREEEARLAVSAAIDLKNPFSSIDPNPFIWNLLLKSLYILIEDVYEDKEEAEKTSLIVTP
ncbi:MAG: hypothetical protein JRJ77_11690 [Deltaproteobacteria bacterium]|nr:hypothetical protein [Deltaproteobacteria bacterium]